MGGFLAGQMKPEILTGFGRFVHDPGQAGRFLVTIGSPMGKWPRNPLNPLKFSLID